MKYTADIRRVRRQEGTAEPVVSYDGSLILDRPTDDDPVTMAELPQLLAEAMANNDIPTTAQIREGVTLAIHWTDADLTP